MTKKGLVLIGFANGAKLPLTTTAIYLASLLHKEQKRNDGTDYVDHVFNACWILIDVGVRDDAVLAATILHDTLEDTSETYDDLMNKFGKEVADLVNSVTKKKGVPIEEYFSQIRDPREVLIKVADRTQNMNDMAKCFSVERLEKYVVETEKYILPMIKETRKKFPEYADALISMKTNIDGILTTAKRAIEEAIESAKLVEENKRLKKKIRNMKKR